jgi:hypothetical protein
MAQPVAHPANRFPRLRRQQNRGAITQPECRLANALRALFHGVVPQAILC